MHVALSPEVAVKKNSVEKLKCFYLIKLWRFLMRADSCLEVGVSYCNFACGLAGIPDTAAWTTIKLTYLLPGLDVVLYSEIKMKGSSFLVLKLEVLLSAGSFFTLLCLSILTLSLFFCLFFQLISLKVALIF